LCSGAMATAGVAGSFLTTQRSTPRRCARARATQRPRARPTPSLPNLGMFSAATTTWTKVQIHQPSSRAASGNDGAGLGWASMQGATPLPSKHSSQARVWEQGAISNRRRHGRPASNNASTRRALWGTTMPAFVQGGRTLRRAHRATGRPITRALAARCGLGAAGAHVLGTSASSRRLQRPRPGRPKR